MRRAAANTRHDLLNEEVTSDETSPSFQSTIENEAPASSPSEGDSTKTLVGEVELQPKLDNLIDASRVVAKADGNRGQPFPELSRRSTQTTRRRVSTPTMRSLLRGSTEINRRNIPHYYMQDWFHTLLTFRWQVQLLCIFTIYFGVNGLFALLYFLGDYFGQGECIRGFETPEDYLWLSVQTLTTVGYGRLEARSQFLQVVAAIEATVGIMLLSLCSGLVYSIVARPRSRVWFSTVAVVEPQLGTSEFRRFHFRIANTRDGSDLYDTHMQVSLGFFVRDALNGGHRRVVRHLKLVNDGYYPRVGVGLSYHHVIDKSSPLYPLSSREALEEVRARLVAVFVCHDGDWSTTTATHHTYEVESVLFDHLFVNLTSKDPRSQELFFDYANFNRTKNIRTLLEGAFDQADVNKDGKLTRSELQSFVANPPTYFTENISIEPHLLHMHFTNLMQQGGELSVTREEFVRAVLRLRKVQLDEIDSALT